MLFQKSWLLYESRRLNLAFPFRYFISSTVFGTREEKWKVLYPVLYTRIVCLKGSFRKGACRVLSHYNPGLCNSYDAGSSPLYLLSDFQMKGSKLGYLVKSNVMLLPWGSTLSGIRPLVFFNILILSFTGERK